MSTTAFVYGKARVAFGSGIINWLTGPVNAMYVTSAYSPSPATDQYVSDIPAPAIVTRDYALTGVGITNSGVCFGTPPPLNAFSSGGAAIAAIVLYVKSGSDATSRLLYYSSSGIGFPFIGQGFNYVVGFDQANGGFFQV